MIEFKSAQRDYPLSFKIAVVEQVEKGEITCKQTQLRYGIQDHSIVMTWLRKHGHLNWALGIPHISCQSFP
jgi:transposase-like protein